MNKKRRPSATAGTGDIRCPFFVAHNEIEIVCEGMIEGCRCSMRFKKAERKKFHEETYCEKEYKRCEMYCSINHWRWPEE